MMALAISYQLMLQQSNRAPQRICCQYVSFAVLSHTASAQQYLCRMQIEHYLLPVCISLSWICASSMKKSIAGAACVPLCLGDWYLAVGAGWLRHCHSLDVMRKSTLDLPLWSALQTRESSGCELTAINRGRSIPESLQTRGRWLSSSQIGARLTELCSKILTSLSQTVTSQACVGRGREREERLGGGQEEQAWVADTRVSLSVSESFFKGGVGVLHWWWGLSTIYCGTALTPLTTGIRPNCSWLT